MKRLGFIGGGGGVVTDYILLQYHVFKLNIKKTILSMPW